MKTAIYTVFLVFISSTITSAQTSLEGKITDSYTGSSIIFGTVALYKGDVLISGVETDLDGIYSFSDIDSGVYDVEASYIGYIPQKQVGVVVKSGIVNHLNFELSEGGLMDEIEIVEYKKAQVDYSSTSEPAVTSDKIKSLPKKSIGGMATSISGIASPPTSDLTMRSTRSAESIHHVDGVRSSEPSAFDKSALPKSGQMTAGEWNDLHNWKDWMTLLENENYSIMMERFAIHPTDRYSVLVVNHDNAVLPNISVQLLDDDDSILWETYTDNSGKAELWENAMAKNQNASAIKVGNRIIRDITKIEDGDNTIVLQEDCSSPDKMDVVFVVDATSSMNDEITYLKSELLDVIDRIEEANENIDFNLGSVFYRDTKDDYLTRVSPLTSNLEETVEFVGNQNSRGGGDNPEAVEAALEETLKLAWRDNALKLVFLILDAPPHEDDITMAKIRSQIAEAARRGIKLIPITASGIGRETEFLMKFMAILTNGTYVFITDDSGIGNPHLDPVVDDYEVEKLNDCLVRLITQYSKSYSCDAEIEKQKGNLEVNVYPNPSTQFINVRTETTPDKIKIYSSNGMMMKAITPDNKETRIELGDFVNGIYTVSVFLGDDVETRQIILIK